MITQISHTKNHSHIYGGDRSREWESESECVCVCDRERERVCDRESEKERESEKKYVSFIVFFYKDKDSLNITS